MTNASAPATSGPKDKNGIPTDPVEREAFWRGLKEWQLAQDLLDHNDEIDDERAGRE